MNSLEVKGYESFEKIKRIRDDGTEYWNARELSVVLEYKKWENFSKVIDRARLSCENSGISAFDHFADVRKMVQMQYNLPAMPVVEFA